MQQDKLSPSRYAVPHGTLKQNFKNLKTLWLLINFKPSKTRLGSVNSGTQKLPKYSSMRLHLLNYKN